MWGPKQEKVPKPVWLLMVYCNKLLQRLPQVKAAVTSPLVPSSDWTPPRLSFSSCTLLLVLQFFLCVP